jgi:hypothetical protein
MTEETLETIILGHIAKELKDEIAVGRQVNLAKTIIQALRIHDVVGRSEQCAHPRDKREYIGSNMLRCKVCGKEFS